MKNTLGILLCLMVLVLTFPKIVLADGATVDETWSMLSDISNKIFLYTENGKIAEAKTMVQLFQKKWSEAVPDTIKLSDKNSRVVNITYDQLAHAFKDYPDNQEVLKDAATEFQLVIDALSSKNNPMWKKMGYKVLSQFNDMKKTAASGDVDAFQSQFNQFLDNYKLIYPALVIDVDPVTLAKVDGDVQRLSNERMQIVHNQANLDHLNKTFTDFNFLFGHFNKETTPHVLWTALAVAGMIILTLVYVSWKKYNGEYRIQSYKFFS